MNVGRVLLQSRLLIQRRFVHSKTRKAFFPVRQTRRVCPKCKRPNSPARSECVECGVAVGEEHDKYEPRDILVEAALGPHKGLVELQRTTQLVVVQHPRPLATTHLLVVCRSGVQNIRALRPNHASLLAQMKYAGLRCLPPLLPWQLYSIRQRVQDLVVFGFDSPSTRPGYGGSCGEFELLHMHVILPPLYSTHLFAYPLFVPLRSVLQQLDEMGQVRARGMSEEDFAAFMKWVDTRQEIVGQILGGRRPRP